MVTTVQEKSQISSSLPLHFSTIGGGSFIQCSCSDSSHTVLILSKATKIFLGGAFAYQVLYGCVDINGYLFMPRKYNPANFVRISVPAGHLPVSLTVRNDLSAELHIERIQSRLREFVNDPRKVIPFIEENQPVAIILIQTTKDIASRFIQQQTPLRIFPQIGHALGENLYLANKLGEHTWMTIEEFDSLKILENAYRDVLKKIYHSLDIDRKSVVFLVGNKGVGKSTLARFLANALNTGNVQETTKKNCRVFMLDTDVGQSESSPPGCVSLYEITKPLLGAPFFSPFTTLSNSYFFGSNNPSVDIDFFLKIVERLFTEFNNLTFQDNENLILIVNSLGWIEDLGYDLTLRMLNLIKPTTLVNLEWNYGVLNFTVPRKYWTITKTIKRENSSQLQTTSKLTSAQLRSFRMAGYLAQLFLHMEQPLSNALRLSDLPAYRVRFRSIAIYIHPEFRIIDDKFMLCTMNCSFVALCRIEPKFAQFFTRKHLLGDESLPSRLELRYDKSASRDNSSKGSSETVSSNDQSEVISVEQEMKPMLRCVGFALIRAISIQRKLFYLLTPVDHDVLRNVEVFAYGHCLNTQDIIFDTNLFEAAPYLIELESGLKETHKKFFSPLRAVSGLKRNFLGRRVGGK